MTHYWGDAAPSAICVTLLLVLLTRKGAAGTAVCMTLLLTSLTGVGAGPSAVWVTLLLSSLLEWEQLPVRSA